MVRRVLVDMSSNVNVMYHDVFVKLRFSKDQLKPVKMSLADFTGKMIEVEGSIKFPVKLKTKPAIK